MTKREYKYHYWKKVTQSMKRYFIENYKAAGVHSGINWESFRLITPSKRKT